MGITIALIQPIHSQGYKSDIPRLNAPVIYIGAFPILTAWSGCRSIYNTYGVPYSSIDTTAAWKKSLFILLVRSDFNMINSLLIAAHAFTRCILTSLSIDEMLLPRYMNLSTDFRELPFRVEMAPSCLKHMYSVLFVFT